MGVDRLDYTKGLVARFRAFERLLQHYSGARRNVIYLQVAQPSRGDVPEYQQMRRELDTAAGEINGRFAEYDWVPLRYLHKGFSHATIVGFLSVARVCLVTPLRDGMNLVAKEFVAAQIPDDPGVLVLSELAGAARELEDAMIVNPYDIDDVAEALATAIDMPLGERRERWQSLIKVLRKNDIHRWRRRFLETLDEAGSDRIERHAPARTVGARGRARARPVEPEPNV
jgi:trehalose 6-phosphate synthase